MDDETYVKKDFSQFPGQQFYTQIHGKTIQDKFKIVQLDKFAAKYLVWQAICTCGHRSAVFITTGTVNADIYIEKCLKKILLPLISMHYGPVLFWPDLASCHYAKKTI